MKKNLTQKQKWAIQIEISIIDDQLEYLLPRMQNGSYFKVQGKERRQMEAKRAQLESSLN